jgi:hypothetical protein
MATSVLHDDLYGHYPICDHYQYFLGAGLALSTLGLAVLQLATVCTMQAAVAGHGVPLVLLGGTMAQQAVRPPVGIAAPCSSFDLPCQAHGYLRSAYTTVHGAATPASHVTTDVRNLHH